MFLGTQELLSGTTTFHRTLTTTWRFFSNHFSPDKRFLEEGLFDRFGICNSTSIVYCCVEHLFVGLLKATLMEQEQWHQARKKNLENMLRKHLYFSCITYNYTDIWSCLVKTILVTYFLEK